ncbi:hypothetical protein [Paraburkholderia panacisoli]|uniref:hypothetical protein n=1 Tax=Paraburkholderia panacisoli TaxID=2603818 RepID=UPI00166006CB|nr:hypothetical protein [Paraburkholderia panacisoli]
MPDLYSLAPPISRHEYLKAASPLKIDCHSPLELRKAVEQLAYYFKRELGFDFVQFEAAETEASIGFVRYEAHLFYETAYDHIVEDEATPHRIFGACCFRWREWTDHAPGWSMDWVWMHPYFRRRGHLRQAWGSFQQHYGDEFHVAPPLSIEMEAFVKANKRAVKDTLRMRFMRTTRRASA